MQRYKAFVHTYSIMHYYKLQLAMYEVVQIIPTLKVTTLKLMHQ